MGSFCSRFLKRGYKRSSSKSQNREFTSKPKVKLIIKKIYSPLPVSSEKYLWVKKFVINNFSDRKKGNLMKLRKQF